MLDSSLDLTEYGIWASRISLVSVPGNSAYTTCLGVVFFMVRT